ncbi:unnamed protein product [Vicia faba]|uniref:Uncharacterized protein n=1 Tax=Vicia faba TaxID=3906 RepID=A0AAV0ZCW6_VICFA|nr:unnamed protein product [Vicia faba]
MSNKNVFEVPVSAEELKIRSELAKKIEKDLEEEIKESIYNLARRLNRIFQQRKEREAKEAVFDKVNNKTRALSKVVINIGVEGGAKIEIKEVNREAKERRCDFRPKKCLKEVKEVVWEKSLRRGSSSVKGAYVRSKQKDRNMMKGRNGSEDKKLFQLVWKV